MTTSITNDAPRRPQTPGMAIPAWIECNGCAHRWTGLSACHCPACHRTFTGIGAFDRHRCAGACQPPANVGLVRIRRGRWQGWGQPGEYLGPRHA